MVIGAGLSGLETAAGLHRAGADVRIIAGDGVRHRPPWRTTLPGHYEAAPPSWPEVGARSLYWHGVVLRLDDWALRDPVWPSDVVDDLCGMGGRPGLYDLVEAELAQWKGEPLAGSGHDAEGTLASALAGALDRPVRTVPRAVRGEGANPSPYTPLARCRELDLDGALHRRRLATAVQVRRGAVVGVEIENQDTREREAIPCARVVLGAGVMENTRLVAQLLGAHEARFSGLADHLVQGFLVPVPEQTLDLPEGTVFAPAGDDARSNLFLRLRPAYDGQSERVLDVWAMGEQLPGGDSAISFEGLDIHPWKMRIEPGLSALDRMVLAAQRELLSDCWRRVGPMLRLTARPLEFPDFLHAPRLFGTLRGRAQGLSVGAPSTYSWALGSVDHESGTLPLGGRHADEAGRIRIVEGAYVTGPATLPRAGAANPSLTTLALAHRTASTLVSDA